MQPGFMSRPSQVSDPAVGTAPLRAGVRLKASRIATLEDVPTIAARARQRVVDALRAFIATTTDDRFLQAAIFAERVQRVRRDREAVWVPSPREIDALANIALSLFAADVLQHRDFHERRLCVCEVCGRVSFHPELTTRA
ncbi:MAG TPA: hypothetical protein VHB21_18980, partial [Minicystis sp.]|nr:hypothetical protein [Minicystis sp.]